MARLSEFLERPVAGRVNREVLLYAALVIVAASLRFWDLGSRALHHDESLHALYSWYLYVGRGYQHDPMMHGPFQFHATALVYLLLGASDYTARILPALFGSALVALPYFLRSFLGRAGALATALLLTISPSFLYFSRFARNDIYIAVWTMLLVIAIWRYEAERRPRYLYLAAAALALGFATKEVAYISVAIMGGYLLAVGVLDLWRAARSRSLSRLGPRGAMLLVVGTLALPQLGAATALAQGAFGLVLASSSAPYGLPRDAGIGVAVGVVVVLLALSALLGLAWNRGLWLRCAAVFYGIYVVLYTTVFTNPLGFGTGIWQSLGYWLAQQGVQRGGQPPYYYLLLLPLYEFLPLVVAMVGGVYYIVRGDRFTRFLIWWAVAAFVLYSYAGEKMPWLVLHLALPIILLAGRTLGDAATATSWRGLWRNGGVALAIALPACLLAWRAVVVGSAQIGTALLLGGVAVGLAGLSVWLVARLNGRQVLVAIVLLPLAAMFALTVRAAFMASYQYGDTPVEMLVYTQTSPDIPRVMRDIEELARQTGQGTDLKITIDSTSGFTWPWAWYLRDYKKVDYPEYSPELRPGWTGPPGPPLSAPPQGQVLLIHAQSLGKAKGHLAAYGEGQRIPHRWWFPEDYRSLTLDGVVSAFTNAEARGQLWDYFLHRKLSKSLGSEDAIVYFPKGFAPTALLVGEATAPGAVASPSPTPPTAVLTVSLSIGSTGDGAGQFNAPRGVAVDSAGAVYVVDTANHRLQKFDAQGRFVAQVGEKGDGPGQFNEPWGVAVDAQGFIYVADTWNHRIQKLGPDLKFVAQWGGFGDARDAPSVNPGRFFGPRGIAVDAAGAVWVADTGNKRVQRFDRDGNFQAAFGGGGAESGQFQEPVGIAVGGQGNLFVADTWNRRVQVFDGGFRFVRQFAVAAWEGTSLANKPYLAVAADGSVIATDPDANRLLLFNADGVLQKTVGRLGGDAAGLNLPTGVAADGRGRVWVADAGNNRIVRFDALR